MEWLTTEQMRSLSDAELVMEFRDRLHAEESSKRRRIECEELVVQRLIEKEEQGEKARIQLASGEDVSLADEDLYFKYEEKDLERTHEWLKANGLGNLIKEPKVHHASLNSNVRELVRKGVDIPEWFEITTKRQLSKRGMR